MNATLLAIYILSFFCAFAIGILSIPKIMLIAKRKKLMDIPDGHRKFHSRHTPNLGGVGIFFAYTFVTSLFVGTSNFKTWNYILAASLLLFVAGVKDDLEGIGPMKKLITQIAAAFITAYFADIRLSSLHGFLGIWELPYWTSISLTVLGCSLVSNAFNLIDGIDGLAGSFGSFAAFILGFCLAANGQSAEACMAFSLAGALSGFLRYNIAPAKIFMGDTGSLVIGFALSILCLRLVEVPGGNAGPNFTLALGILFMPLFDCLRVFTTRVVKGKSPFEGDRSHLHHYLLDVGLKQTQAVAVILSTSAVIVALAFGLQSANLLESLLVFTFIASLVQAAVLYLRRRRFIAVKMGALRGQIVTMGNASEGKQGLSVPKEIDLIEEAV